MHPAHPPRGAHRGLRLRGASAARRIQSALGSALVAGGSVLAAVRVGGRSPSGSPRPAFLTAWQFEVLRHVARRVTAPDRPDDPSIPDADTLDVARFVDGWLGRLPEPLRRDFVRMLAYIEHVGPLAAGRVGRFTRLRPEHQDRVLTALEASSNHLLRAGFDGVRSLVFLGYYRDPRTWATIGYDGPRVGRPEGGWR